MPQHGTKAPVSGGSIVNGQYEINMRGGVPVGKHHVEITSFRKLPKRYADTPEATVPKEQLLPKKYNTETELEQEIISGQSLTLDFPLGNKYESILGAWIVMTRQRMALLSNRMQGQSDGIGECQPPLFSSGPRMARGNSEIARRDRSVTTKRAKHFAVQVLSVIPHWC